MKKLFLSVMLVAFSVAVTAGEGDKACCPKKAGDQAKAASTCPVTGKQVKSQCPSGAKKDTLAKVTSPKGAEQAKR